MDSSNQAIKLMFQDQSLHDVMQEALMVHFQGLCFRERNAGRNIDAHMTDKGFNNQIGVHPETGEISANSKQI
jgi:glycogen debranching enzyme